MKAEQWKETRGTSTLEARPERTDRAEAERMIESLRRVRIRTMLVQSLCKNLDAEKR